MNPSPQHAVSELPVKNGMVQYVWRFGGTYFIVGMKKERIPEEKARQEKMLADYNATGLQVTLKY